MASNNSQNPIPFSSDRRPPTRVHIHDQTIWDNAKSAIYQTYMQENKSLKFTRAAIQESHGVEKCPTTWKMKIKEWNFKKNRKAYGMQCTVAQGTKRVRSKDTTFPRGERIDNPKRRNRKAYGMQCTVAQGTKRVRGKDTTFSRGERIDNPKRRKTREVSPSVTMSPVTTYSTPSLNSDGPPQPYSFSVPQPSSMGLLNSETENPLNIRADIPEVPHISMLSQYLSDKVQPWSVYNLSHCLSGRDTASTNDKKISHQVLDLSLSEKQNSLSRLCSIYQESFLGSSLEIDNEEDGTFDAAAPIDLSSLVVALDECEKTDEEFAPSILVQELNLDNAFEKSGNYEEAENYCRRILSRQPNIEVQLFLGLILASSSHLEEATFKFQSSIGLILSSSSRLEEATFMLFCALTHFIIQFITSPTGVNIRLYMQIELLFTALNDQSNQDWDSLNSCMCQMLATIQNVFSEEITYHIFRQLLIHGFSVAHECAVLGTIDSAKYMYRNLLTNASFDTDAIYQREKATAHQKYACLLRREKMWAPSADQLLLSCKSIIISGLYDPQFIKNLESDYVNLCLHLPAEPNEEDSIAVRILNQLTIIQCRDNVHMQGASTVVPLRGVNEYSSSDLPFQSGTSAKNISHGAQFGMPSGGTESEDGGRASTTNWSASNKGVTYPDSEITGISDSKYMVP